MVFVAVFPAINIFHFSPSSFGHGYKVKAKEVSTMEHRILKHPSNKSPFLFEELQIICHQKLQ
jgi:hypothetical protein